jgi:hypothetical protein
VHGMAVVIRTVNDGRLFDRQDGHGQQTEPSVVDKRLLPITSVVRRADGVALVKFSGVAHHEWQTKVADAQVEVGEQSLQLVPCYFRRSVVRPVEPVRIYWATPCK